jgi:hypothetical protein
MTQTQLQRHPIRGAVWGLILGLGIAIALTFVWPVIGLDDIAMVAVKWALIVGGVMLLSILWGLFGPARKPKGPEPAPAYQAPSAWEEPPPPPAEG